MMTMNPGTPMTPTRRALLAIGVGTVALSLVLSIAPALAKSANTGTVKVHDFATGLEATETNNEPHVCSFWVSFDGGPSAEEGTWELLSWPDKAIVDSGTYNTGLVGQDVTGTLSPEPGHYRFEWAATDANGKNKMLWVSEDCGDETASEEEVTSPSEAASPSEEEVTSPSEAAATATPTPSESETTPVGEVAAVIPSESPLTQPSEDPAQTESSPTPEGDVLAGNPDVTPPSLPNTSTGFETSGLLAALGILLIVGAHAHTRRSGQSERV